MREIRCGIEIVLPWILASLTVSSVAGDQDQKTPQPSTAPEERIVTPEEVERAIHPPVLLPLRIIAYPHRLITSGMEKGLISFERNRLLPKFQLWSEEMRRRGVNTLFGGLGEGAGFGAGGAYQLGFGGRRPLQLLGRASFKGYQEFDIQWVQPLEKSELVLEASYQWRPQENLYGLGHRSLKSQRSNFALRQTWTGLRWELKPVQRVRVGSEYKRAWLLALEGRNPAFSSSGEFFPQLAGLGEQTELHSVGVYFDADLFQGEYLWGANAHWGASYQHGAEGARLRYFRYEIQLEGRMPVREGHSAIVGQASIELNRERGGSPPLPFYLLPHIGGSSTLRGFALDRFYGRNIMLMALEYRYRLHPNIQALLFFDEGQIFNRTSELSWLNWHRNYGLGFKLLAGASTYVRVEYGRSKEGFQFHLSFGDRERRPLGGPIRYGTYRR